MTLKTTVSGDTIFLQGKFLSFAVGAQGALGSTSVAAGHHAYALGEVTGLGLYADLDGFGTGKTSSLADVAAMGAVIERFNIGYTIGGVKHLEGNTRFGTSTIKGASSNMSDGSAARAGWTGTTDEKLQVSQVMSLTDDAKFIRVDITLTNKSGGTMDDVRYMRSIDPDQDLSSKNNIKIVEQGGDGSKGALIAAYTVLNTNPFFYYTADDRAKVSTYGALNRDTYVDAAWTKAQAEGFTAAKVDQAVNITFAAGDLHAGQSTTLTFYMGVTDDLAATVAEIDALQPTSPTTPTNAAPIAADDSAAAAHGGSTSGNVLLNDKDPEGAKLTAALEAGPANGAVKLAADGSFTYTAKAGFSGQDSFTYSASDGSKSDTAKVVVTVAGPSNAAPDAVNDSAATVSGKSVSGDVLANDKDADGQTLSASLVAGPANGTVSLGTDGKFTYVAKAGFVGTDSFTYAASDGKASDRASVTVTVSAPAKSALEQLLEEHDAVNGSGADSAVLTGKNGHNAFYFDTAASSGKDVIAEFEDNDVLIFSSKLYDGNNDGRVSFRNNTVRIDGLVDGDSVKLGAGSLRYLGEAIEGAYVYAQGTVRPKNAKEGTLGDDALAGDTPDRSAQKFFFDTALDFNLGEDTIRLMGARDVIVTTVALTGGDDDDDDHVVSFDSDGLLNFGDDDRDDDEIVSFGADGLLDLLGADGGDLGSVKIHNTAGARVDALEFDGAIEHGGTTYYVYSLLGSAAGVDTLGF